MKFEEIQKGMHVAILDRISETETKVIAIGTITGKSNEWGGVVSIKRDDTGEVEDGWRYTRVSLIDLMPSRRVEAGQ